jgi:hypothetical protein
MEWSYVSTDGREISSVQVISQMFYIHSCQLMPNILVMPLDSSIQLRISHPFEDPPIWYHFGLIINF